MKKVITYGTYDLLHYGHIRLLERAKALGDYLIVGVTSDDYDKSRGKINNQQSLMERIAALEATGIPDKIIVEEYEGQKIDDIKKYDADIFTVGSDWKGKFDYLNEYCKVVYLERTQGVSSSELRSTKRKLSLIVEGESSIGEKFKAESTFVNGIEIVNGEYESKYLVTSPKDHYKTIKRELQNKKHILCESPITLNKEECRELLSIANEKGCILMDAIKTAYSTAYNRLLLLVKSGKIGDVVSIDATCTSMREFLTDSSIENKWNSLSAWGPTALLPIFQILGTKYKSKTITTKYLDKEKHFDAFTKIDFVYDHAVASIKVATQAKSEGDLVITGTKGYIYVPSPWWKTDYFEVRFEKIEDNKRYFYQLDGEGIRNEMVCFAKSIETGKNISNIDPGISIAITEILEEFEKGNVIEI